MPTQHGLRTSIEVAGEAYEVLSCRLTERLDEIPRLEVKLWKDGGIPRPVSLLDAQVSFALGDIEAFDAGRRFRGIVVEAERRIDTSGRPYIALAVCPALWNLTKRTDVRTFQKLKVEAIVAQVLDGAGVKKHRFELQATYDVREYVVQYRESDFDFIRRLLSEEGIAFAYDHDKEEVVLFDDPHGLGMTADATLPYRPEFGFDQTGASVWKVSEAAHVLSDHVHLREYDFRRPRFDLEGDTEGTDAGEHALETYVFPARSVKDATVKRFSDVLLDAIQCRRDVVRGAGTSWSLAAGYRFNLEQHPFEDLNGELLVTSVSIEHEDERSPVNASGVARTNLQFEAIPTRKSSYRPARRPRAREIPGAETAVVTGAAGQEIHVDDLGRVNVSFPWDRVGKKDETSSLAIRTSQLPTGGSMLIPRVGWEVLVQHDEGDADLPLCMSRLYNTEKPPPYALPAAAARSAIQTATTPGGGSSNELRTDDSAGKEEMFLNASKDMTVLVNHNVTESIGNNAQLRVGANRKVDVTNSVSVNVGGNQTLDVGGNQSTPSRPEAPEPSSACSTRSKPADRSRSNAALPAS